MPEAHVCDILIVGGGIAGASLAARLAGEARVTLIESEDLCGRHSTGRSAAFWVASLGSSPGRKLSIASKPMFDEGWPGSETPLLRRRGTVHLTGQHGDTVEGAEDLVGEHALIHLDRAELETMVPGLREQWTGGWYEPTCADIEVAAFHAACLAAVRRAGGAISAGLLVNAAGAWADDVAARCGVPPLGLQPMRRTVVQIRVGRVGLRDLPLVTDLHDSFYFKGEGTSSVWVIPLDETPVDPCDAAPEEIDVATAIDRFEQAVDWPVEAVERKWAGLRTFAPDRILKLGFEPLAPGFFWCAGQGGMGIQTAPAASLLCAALIRSEPLPEELAGLDPAVFVPRAKA